MPARRAWLAVVATVIFAGASHGQSEMSLAEREPVRIFFQTVYEASEGIPSGWTGNVALGEAGSTSPAFQRAVGVRINYFRAMAGVPASVALSSSYSTPDQWAALLVSANSQLSHYPTAAWKDYTAPGAAAAADSNLILGVDGPAAVDAYIQDAGATNYFVGHRRWVLYPQTRKMGTGDIDADPAGTYPAANALWVLDGMFGTARPATRDGFVAWPPPGYVPEQLIYNRWSLAYPEADFSQARVQMSRGGKSVSVLVERQSQGDGDNAIVWVPRGLNASASAISATAGRDITTSVTVSNVLVDGTARTFKYNVTSFDPARTGPDTVFTSVNGPSAASVGAATPYKFTAIPHATGYRWEADYVVPLSLLDTAAGGPGNVTVTPASVSVTTSSPLGDGAPCYQLTNDPPAAITLNQVIIPTATSTLQFSDLMGYATQTELGEIQISTDQGLTWNTLYSRPGTGGAPEAAFTPESVSLSPYAGLECIIRFVYSATGTYRAFSAGTGWFVENISVNNAWQVQGTAKHGTLPAAASSLAFTAPQAGTYALRVVPVFYGSYPDVYLTGPVLLVGTDPSQ